MTNIVICCDGTWNTPEDKELGVPIPTNVVRIYNVLADMDEHGTKQHKYYHPGVGTDGSWWDKAIGGGTGKGLNNNIMSAYRELCDTFQHEAKIFLFGFSRGAYTVRSLAGLVTCCGLLKTNGLPDSELWKRIERVFEKGYRRKSETRKDWDALGWHFHNDSGKTIPVHFLGVWDTVGALGIPDDMAFLNLIDSLHDYTFHDTKLSPAIKTARHAIALDEVRASFQPTLWTETAGKDVEQVWFPGVHSDVGGGYRETGLSDGALAWMMQEAESAGLVFNTAMRKQIKPDYLDVLHDSCSGVFSLLPTQPRSVPLFGANGSFHDSAIDRQGNPPIHQCPYREIKLLHETAPVRLEVFAMPQWNPSGIWLEEGVKYTFSAEGQWMDSAIKCGPEGTNDGHFQLGELGQVAGSLLGKAEELFKKITGNKAADFRFTKRHEGMPWFCLVGAVANGGGVDGKGRLELHESFEIGQQLTYIPKKSGYFYAYANDAWNCYENNRGRVNLTIRKN